MILKADRIAELLEGGDENDRLVITPSPDLDELKQSGAASIDLRLGTWSVTLRQARMSHLQIDGTTPNAQFSKQQYVGFGDEYILHPQSFVLGVTLEWLRIPRTLSGSAVGRSSWGRRGLIIATATAVHPGFTGCLTLELTNVGEIPIAISPGMTICQFVLERVEATKAGTADNSQFLGCRQTSVGRIEPDQIANALAKSRR